MDIHLPEGESLTIHVTRGEDTGDLQEKLTEARRWCQQEAHENTVLRRSMKAADAERAELRELLKVGSSQEIRPKVFALMNYAKIEEDAHSIVTELIDIIDPSGQTGMHDLPGKVREWKEALNK